MPSTRWKAMARPRNLGVPKPWDSFSDVEVFQCSPHLCAICEHSGDLVICDGPCHRQFHFKRSAQESATSHCPSVCIPDGNAGEPWRCPDCTTGRAKCFECGTLGIMHVDIRKCFATYCVRWYCRLCFPSERSTCSLHHCSICDLPFESLSLHDAVQCLRCPTSWHHTCLRKIQHKDVNRARRGVDHPPWRHVAHGQIPWMVYCPAHKLDPTLGTHVHDHIAWLGK